jgi:hypothetical protein
LFFKNNERSFKYFCVDEIYAEYVDHKYSFLIEIGNKNSLISLNLVDYNNGNVDGKVIGKLNFDYFVNLTKYKEKVFYLKNYILLNLKLNYKFD